MTTTPLLEILRCPFCRVALAPDGDSLVCPSCERVFERAANGIPLMLHHDLPGAQQKLREAEGWLEKAQQEGCYEADDTVDAVLPFVNRELGWNDPNWLPHQPFFPVLLRPALAGGRGLRAPQGRAG